MSITTTTNHSNPPKVIIDELVYQKIMHWVNKSAYEVSGLGKVIVSNGEVRVVEAILLPQKNTHTTTDIEAADVGKAMYLMRESPGELRFWWHSHVDMSVFWSGTDLATIRTLCQGGWFVNTVFNKRRQHRTCIAMNDPFPTIIDEIPLNIERVLEAELIDQWDKEYEEKVTNIVPKPMPVAGKWMPGQHSQIRNPGFKDMRTSPSKGWWESPPEDEANDYGLRGVGPDGVYGDSDWPFGLSGQPSGRGELAKGEVTVQSVLDRRDKLLKRLRDLETKADKHTSAGRLLSPRQLDMLNQAEDDLEQVEQELDVLEEAGMIDEQTRYANDKGSRRENRRN